MVNQLRAELERFWPGPLRLFSHMDAEILLAFWRYAGTHHRLLVPGISDEAMAKMNRNYLAGPVVYGSATLIAFAQPYASLAIFAGLAVYWLLPGTGPRAEVLTGKS